MSNSTPQPSVDYRQTNAENATAVRAFRVSYVVPLESKTERDFDSEMHAALFVLDCMRLVRSAGRGVVSVSVL